MSELNLDEIRARADAATPGPWVTGADKTWSDVFPPWALVINAAHPLIELQSGTQGIADAQFIAHARQDVAALLAEVERLRAELDGPCGSCHPCTDWADETWRAAGRKPPHVSEWDELRAELDRLRAKLAVGDDSRLDRAERRVSLAQGLAEDWAANKDDLLASAGMTLLNTLGGAR